jgi:hypothetical protein
VEMASEKEADAQASAEKPGEDEHILLKELL